MKKSTLQVWLVLAVIIGGLLSLMGCVSMYEPGDSHALLIYSHYEGDSRVGPMFQCVYKFADQSWSFAHPGECPSSIPMRLKSNP